MLDIVLTHQRPIFFGGLDSSSSPEYLLLIDEVYEEMATTAQAFEILSLENVESLFRA